MSITHDLRRAAVPGEAVGATGLLTAGVAAAHVTANVYGELPEKGGVGAIVLRVPNEEPKAGTIGSARTRPVPDWTAEVPTSTLQDPVRNGAGAEVTEIVTMITWTTQPGHAVPAGTTSYQEFALTAGPLPNTVDTLVVPAVQTYSDGTVVRWDELPTEDTTEPEHPAPAVELTAASGNGHGASGEPTPDATTDATAKATEAADAGGGDTTARWLGGAELALGALDAGAGPSDSALLRARRAGKASS